MSSQMEEMAPAAPGTPSAPAKPAANKKKSPASKAKQVVKPNSARKKPKKSKGPGKYSQLVIDTIRSLGERGGSSLVRIYKEARKESWFDQQHGRVYLRSSIRALLLNDTLVQVKGLGANGSFKLNKNKVKTKETSAKPRKTAKPSKKPSDKAGEKKTGVKKTTSAVKKPSKAKKTGKKPEVSAAKKKKKVAKTKKIKQIKKTHQKS
ncbi:histone H1.10 [Trichomycterus rosablanca]|uniref:histone H1.10 n=1 Tax=Trichomycterus rosablanca TaxID=2290929 RepID=UPI002F355407